MITAKLPSDEELRLLDLVSLEILDTPAEREFDEIVELAGFLTDCPVSLISLIDKDRQWFKAKRGLAITETPRDYAFCSHTILSKDVMIIADATQDERFKTNPLVTGQTNLRFYAGAPILSPAGYKIGAICIIDEKPKQITAEQERALKILSSQITKLLELRAWNRVIKERAEELLDLKNETVRLAFTEHDEQKRAISAELHENMAQVVAASRMYLSMAEQNEAIRLPLIKSTNEELGELLISMRTLSTSITPATFGGIPLQEMIHDYTAKGQWHFNIKFQFIGESTSVSIDMSLAIIRLLEKWLGVLDQRPEVGEVEVILETMGKLTLTIEDDGGCKEFKEMEKDLITSSIYNRMENIGGRINFSTFGRSSLQLLLEPAVEVSS